MANPVVPPVSPERSVSSGDSHRRSGWILVAGFALATLGLVAESGQQQPEPPTPQPGSIFAGYGTADSNDRMIAVTGVDVTGGSLLYVVDTQTRRLSVYQATGGTNSTMNVKWVGARNIDLDLQVDGWNDKSELSYQELDKQFASDVAPPDDH